MPKATSLSRAQWFKLFHASSTSASPFARAHPGTFRNDMKLTEQVAIAAACAILTFVLGCQTIRNEATVKIPASESPQDEALSKAVQDRLRTVKKADLNGVKVVSSSGKVYLGGTVTSLDARDQAVRIAWNSPGVQSVVNALEVQSLKGAY